jgi:Ring finger domain
MFSSCISILSFFTRLLVACHRCSLRAITVGDGSLSQPRHSSTVYYSTTILLCVPISDRGLRSCLVVWLGRVRLGLAHFARFFKDGSLLSTLDLPYPHSGSRFVHDYLPCPLQVFHHANLTHILSSMSGTCIVCLGDLGDGSCDPLGLPPTSAKSPVRNSEADCVTTTPNQDFANEKKHDSDMIAHLKPCAHNLHNDCLTPWVERANSCPICRARFYTVELSNKVGGMT